MGGYAVNVRENADGDTSTRRIRLKPKDFVKLANLQSLELPTEAELMDKSKGDWISKSITSVQVIWFVSQLIGRAIQKLPVTTLELFTCAIVVCAVATYISWWNKPLDVQRPIVLGSEVSADFLAKHGIHALDVNQSLLDDNDLPGPFGIDNPRVAALFLLVVLAFAASHLAGWNFHFATRIEQLLWRVASIMCGGVAIFMAAVGRLDDYITLGRRLREWPHKVFNAGIVVYMLVRAYLLVEVFVGLRSVPADVYLAVNWSAYIPHI